MGILIYLYDPGIRSCDAQLKGRCVNRQTTMTTTCLSTSPDSWYSADMRT